MNNFFDRIVLCTLLVDSILLNRFMMNFSINQTYTLELEGSKEGLNKKIYKFYPIWPTNLYLLTILWEILLLENICGTYYWFTQGQIQQIFLRKDYSFLELNVLIASLGGQAVHLIQGRSNKMLQRNKNYSPPNGCCNIPFLDINFWLDPTKTTNLQSFTRAYYERG